MNIDVHRSAERHRLPRVGDQVEKDLLELVRAPEHERVCRVVGIDELHTLVGVRPPNEIDRRAHDVLDLHDLALSGIFAGEIEQRPDDLLDLQSRFRISSSRCGRRAFLGLLEEELRQAEDREQRVVDLVGDTGGELPDRGELPALCELLVELPPLGQVGDDAE